MLGKVPSLNVSVAGAVVMYEIVRQRRAHDRDTDDRDKDDKDKHKDRNKNEEASVGGR
jgi:tRNA C32,U32 (ribose-2'-O)-methylase TrmJ